MITLDYDCMYRRSRFKSLLSDKHDSSHSLMQRKRTYRLGSLRWLDLSSNIVSSGIQLLLVVVVVIPSTVFSQWT